MTNFSTVVSIVVGVSTIITVIIIPCFKLAYDYKRNKEKLRDDYKVLKELKELQSDDRMILLLILNHIIDGNNIEKIKETRNKVYELQREEK